jgi:RNA polymerase sigma factor (TIGR02999 family)
MGDVTLLIEQAREGDRAAFDRIFELLYPELRKVAHRRLMRSAKDGLVETTALVNECYMKFIQRDRLTPGDRAHFLAYAATVMRSIIVDAARAAGTDRRGGDAEQVPLDTDLIDTVPNPAGEILDVHAALENLASIDPRLARVVEMRYFAGMSDDEIAEALTLSSRTVRRDWEKARLLLAHELRG